MRRSPARWALFFALLGLATPGAAERQLLTVGSKRFTESYILGEIVARTAAEAGEAAALHKPGLGSTAIVFEALRSGAIDVYPDYTGTVAREILRLDSSSDSETLARALAPLGLGVGPRLGFTNGYALAMRAEHAEGLGIRRISDLPLHPSLRLGLSQEFIGRADGWEGLKRAYALPFATPRGLEHGLAYEALAAGKVDVVDAYTTDAKIAKFRLHLLEDDLGYFPRYDAVLLYRLELPPRLPKTWDALEDLAGRIDERRMREMNAQAELQGRGFAAIAAAFVSGGTAPPAPRPGLLGLLFGPDLARLTAEHLMLVFASLGGALLVGIPLGILAERVRVLRQPVLTAVGVVQTIPALALLAFLIPVFRTIGVLPALAALFLYSLLPIVRNTCTGLAETGSGLRQAAFALGLTGRQSLRHVELPLALPTILAGIQTAAVINVGTATIAAFIGAGGYGERIVQGLALNDNTMLLAGAVPAAALALLVHGAFELLERRLAPGAHGARRTALSRDAGTARRG
jgi:osmoprotectant transport system permease protein